MSRLGLHARVEHRREQRDRQQQCGGQDHHRAHALSADAGVAETDGAHRETGGGHRGVVHAADGHPHNDGRTRLGDPDPHAAQAPQAEEDQQRGCRGHTGDGRRRRHQPAVPDDARRHLLGRHARVMHRTDAAPHRQGPGQKQRAAEPFARGNVQRERRHRDGGNPGDEGGQRVVADRDGQRERQHAHEVHRPDAGSHYQRSPDHPNGRRKAVPRAHPPRQIERHERSEGGDQHRQGDPARVVAGLQEFEIHACVEWRFQAVKRCKGPSDPRSTRKEVCRPQRPSCSRLDFGGPAHDLRAQPVAQAP